MAPGQSLTAALPAPIPGTPPLDELLGRALALTTDERTGDAALLQERWTNRAFVALVVGEFKRGKSTLLNALVGESLLPTGVPPVTTVPTRVRAAGERRALVRFLDGSEREIPRAELGEYVDEARNPGNRRGVASVEACVVAGLPPGVVMVDVPGLGSVHGHNTASALAALPEADAALVVVSVDPPIGEAEIRLLRSVREHAARVDVVLNKIDYLDDAQRRAALDFTREALGRHGFGELGVWPVSAREGLEARLRRDELGWRRSGMEALSAHLARFLEHERGALLAKSLARKAARLVDQEAGLVEMRLAARERSARELALIIAAFRARRAHAERDSAEAQAIYRRRFESVFAGYSERAAEAWSGPRAALEARLGELIGRMRRASRGAAWEAMQAPVREAVTCFAEAFVPHEGERLANAYALLSEELAQAAAERAEAVWRLAADLLPFDPPRVDAAPAPPAPRPSYLPAASLRLMLDDLADAAARLLPRGAALRRLAAQAREEADAQYGRVVEQSRETFVRAYEEHFQGQLAGFEAGASRTAAALEAALAAAEARARAAEDEGQRPSDGDEARLAALRRLRDELRHVEAGRQEP